MLMSHNGTTMENKFRNNFEVFKNNFEEKFIDFFSSECDSYNYALDLQSSRKIVQDILESILCDELVLSELSNNTFTQMKDDGIMIGLLLNKSLLYMLENYSIFLKEEEGSQKYLDMLIHSLNKFSHFFEDDINNKKQEPSVKIGFGDDNIIYSKNNIVDIFSQIKKENKTIKFMNLYQGIPISHEGVIVDIDDESVVFRITNELQEIAMKLEGKAYIIKNEYLPRHVKADISYSNFSNNTIVLNNFVFLLNMPAIERKFVRIYPDVLVHVFLVGEDNERLSGNLYDLSQKGLGLISEHNVGFCNGAKILISFELDGKYSVETEGEIVNIIEYINSYRYCLKISPDKENAENIIKYISKRENEIILDLRNELNSYIF